MKAFDGSDYFLVIIIITVEFPSVKERGQLFFIKFRHELYHSSNKSHCLLGNPKDNVPLENLTRFALLG